MTPAWMTRIREGLWQWAGRRPTEEDRAGEGARRRQQRLLLDALLLGAVGAVAAQIFMSALRLSIYLFQHLFAGYVAPGLPTEGGSLTDVIGPHGLWLIPVSTTIGGIIVGFLVERFAPEAEGHGTDGVVKAFHRHDGAIRARVPGVKIIASAITIGSGGSAGREGPIALVAAGVGSAYATLTGRVGRDRRLLMLTGMAAGLSAIFRSPVGCALMAIEVLYADMEFEAGALIYALLASIVAYALNGFIDGWEPLFRIPADIGRLPRALDYLGYVALGIAAGLVALVVPIVFYRVRDAFRASRIPPVWRPAMGGLLTGLLALTVPQILGGGYGWMQLAIDGQLALGTLLLLTAAKWIATSFTVASGGSGGVFAPSLYVGAMLGGAWAALMHAPPAPFVIVGMAAVFAGAAHVPMATLMMVTEMTGGYRLLVPAALAVVLSYVVQTRLAYRVRFRSLYEGQVASRAESPAHHTRHLEIALQILRDHRPQDVSGLGELNLVSLLRSGIPVELPGDRRLVVGTVRPQSRFIGKPLDPEGGHFDTTDTSVIAILRGEHMTVPTPKFRIEAGDRLIMVAGAGAVDVLRPDIEPW